MSVATGVGREGRRGGLISPLLLHCLSLSLYSFFRSSPACLLLSSPPALPLLPLLLSHQGRKKEVYPSSSAFFFFARSPASL